MIGFSSVTNSYLKSQRMRGYRSCSFKSDINSYVNRFGKIGFTGYKVKNSYQVFVSFKVITVDRNTYETKITPVPQTVLSTIMRENNLYDVCELRTIDGNPYLVFTGCLPGEYGLTFMGTTEWQRMERYLPEMVLLTMFPKIKNTADTEKVMVALDQCKWGNDIYDLQRNITKWTGCAESYRSKLEEHNKTLDDVSLKSAEAMNQLSEEFGIELTI